LKGPFRKKCGTVLYVVSDISYETEHETMVYFSRHYINADRCLCERGGEETKAKTQTNKDQRTVLPGSRRFYVAAR